MQEPFDYISPSNVFSRVRMMLKTYFSTGIITDMLFYERTEDLLKKIGISVLDEKRTAIKLVNHRATLPSFHMIQEVWSCDLNLTQAGETVTTGIDIDSHYLLENGTPYSIIDYTTHHKETNLYPIYYTRKDMLFPGNVATLDKCDNCKMGSSRTNIYRIENKSIITNIESGWLYVKYKVFPLDEDGYPLIPDIVEVRQCLEQYLMYKCFEEIMHAITDESYSQVQQKFTFYKQEYEAAFVHCTSYMIAPSFQKLIKDSRRRKSAHRRYNIR